MSGKRSSSKVSTTLENGTRASTPVPGSGSSDATLVNTAGAADNGQIDLSIDIVGIEELQNHGINVSDIQKLKSAGVHSISVSLTKR